MKATSLSELWQYRLEMFREFIDTEKRIPAYKEVYKEWRIREWLGKQKKKMQDKESAVYKELCMIHDIV